jgi:hypothetical protein
VVTKPRIFPDGDISAASTELTECYSQQELLTCLYCFLITSRPNDGRQTYVNQGKAGSSAALQRYREGIQHLPAGAAAAGATVVPVAAPKPGNGKPGAAAGEGEGGRINRATPPSLIISDNFCHKRIYSLYAHIV